MHLAQDNDVVHTFPPDRSDQPLGIAILPRRGWCGGLVPDAHATQSARDDAAKDTIPIGFGYGGYYPYYYDDYSYDYPYGYGYSPYAYEDTPYDNGSCYVVQRRVHTAHGWRQRPVQVCG